VKFPHKIDVKNLRSSRYKDNLRPANWDFRMPGKDVVESNEGEVIILHSDGDQTPPRAGWRIMLTSGDSHEGFHWTLSGFDRSLM
jgi:hypothetical protein